MWNGQKGCLCEYLFPKKTRNLQARADKVVSMVAFGVEEGGSNLGDVVSFFCPLIFLT
jgi:hypothetical protein